jgi:hypothetical protein
VAWPLLQERFESLQNADGIFPLLTRTQEARFADAAKAAADDAKKRKDKPTYRPNREAVSMDNRGCSIPNVPTTWTWPCTLGGEISFPGGHFDNSNSDSTPPDGDTSSLLPDQTLLDTALREAHEELLPPFVSPDQTHQHQQQRRPSGNSSSSLLQQPHLTISVGTNESYPIS